MRQSMNFQTARTSRIVSSVATIYRPRPGSDASDVRGTAKLFGERVDSLRQREIELGDSAFAVRGKDQAHLVVADIDVGMMLLLFGDFSDRVNKIDRVGEIVEL